MIKLKKSAKIKTKISGIRKNRKNKTKWWKKKIWSILLVSISQTYSLNLSIYYNKQHNKITCSAIDNIIYKLF